MNTISSNFRNYIEYDLNPFLIFNHNGDILYLNQSAEYLINEVRTKELFELAITYAPKSYGNKVTHINLSYGFLKFYAINVLYDNDDEIALHLYTKPIEKLNKDIKLDGFTKTDFLVLFNAHLELFKMDFSGKIRLFADFDIPKFYLNQNIISILVRKTLNLFANSNTLNIDIKIKIGEMVLINNKKYPILNLIFQGENRDLSIDDNIKDIASKNFINAFFTKDSVSFEIPFITA